MLTFCYIIILLIVVVLAIMVLLRLHRRTVHLRNMAEFYRDTHWWKEPKQGIYCEISIKDDPLADIGYISGDKIEGEIKEIIKRFKKDPDLLKDTERNYRNQQQAHVIKQEVYKKELIKKRVFAYDYEELLFQIYKPTAKEELGEWRLEGLSKDEIIQGISNLKCISSNEAETLFDVLVDHNLIWRFGYKYELSPILCSGNNGWDVVSNIDMNFDKWMVAHRFEHKINEICRQM